nr:MAG TPA: hypothetical protein [Caudoviricetes sp.]
MILKLHLSLSTVMPSRSDFYSPKSFFHHLPGVRLRAGAHF